MDAATNLIRYALKLKTEGYDLFIDYSPHVNMIYVRFYLEWHSGDDPFYRNDIDLDNEFYVLKIYNAMHEINGIVKNLKGIESEWRAKNNV